MDPDDPRIPTYFMMDPNNPASQVSARNGFSGPEGMLDFMIVNQDTAQNNADQAEEQRQLDNKATNQMLADEVAAATAAATTTAATTTTTTSTTTSAVV